MKYHIELPQNIIDINIIICKIMHSTYIIDINMVILTQLTDLFFVLHSLINIRKRN